MNLIPLGTSSLKTSRLAYGCWRIARYSETNEVTQERANHGARAVIAAYEAGYRTFDLADIYANGVCENIFGQVLKQVSGMREQILVMSKCGIRRKGDPEAHTPYRYDFSAEYILKACDASLGRLGIDTIDVYMLHRPDYLANWEEVAGAFDALHQAGKVRYFGVSNFHPAQVTALKKSSRVPIISNQVEISLAKIDCFHDGTIEQCMTDKIVPMAWSPLGAGRIASCGPIDLKSPDHGKRAKVRETIDDIARARGVTRTVIALAWLLRHPAKILPIIGSTNPERITDSVGAEQVELTREEWYLLMEAAYGQKLP